MLKTVLSRGGSFLERLHPIAPANENKQLEKQMQMHLHSVNEAVRASIGTFRPLSVQQLDFSFAPESHTLRWNAEHLASSQVWFFSETFQKVDRRIRKVKVLPKQNPKRYRPLNAGWDGKRLADWMDECNDFCCRYSYLLGQLKLNQRLYRTQFRSLRVMLETVEWHFYHHTNIVRQKLSDVAHTAG